MLGSADVVCFIPTLDMDRAVAFYRTVLGAEPVDVNPYATVFVTDGTTLRVTAVDEMAPRPFTVLGWEVADIIASCRLLAAAGVAFERYDGMTQDQDGIWTTPGGDRVAWFGDPDGNILSLSQHA